MHIVFAADERYANYLAPQLLRISELALPIEGVIAVLSPGVSAKSIDLLREVADKYEVSLTIKEASDLDDLLSRNVIADRTHVSSFTYVKLFLPDILSEYDQVLYLDLDIWITGDIEPLLSWKLQNPIAAVPEMGHNGPALFGNDPVTYFNAGVLRLSLSRLREHNLVAKALTLIESGRQFEYQDQDIFNLIFKGRFDHLPVAFNLFNDLVGTNNTYLSFKSPLIVHFNGPFKPWNSNLQNSFAEEWLSAYRATTPQDASFISRATSKDSTFNRKNRVSKRMTLLFARAHFWLRQSQVGQILRNRLDYRLKKALNDVFYRIWARSENHLILNAAFFSDVTSSRDFDDLVQEPIIPISDFTTSSAAVRSSLKPRFIFVLTQARSGTTAFEDFIARADRSFIAGGELFGGYMRETMYQYLQERFPWVSRKSQAGSDLSTSEFASRMDLEVEAIMHDLQNNPRLVNKTIVIKIFPDHLSNKRLHQLLQQYRPYVVILRRAMIFTLASNLKAMKSGSDGWMFKDNSDYQIELKAERILGYIDWSDRWFSTASLLVELLELENIDISYSGIYETKHDLAKLEKMLENHLRRSISLDPKRSNFTMQDRRTDQYLLDLIAQLSSLPLELRNELLRLPGQRNRR